MRGIFKLKMESIKWDLSLRPKNLGFVPGSNVVKLVTTRSLEILKQKFPRQFYRSEWVTNWIYQKSRYIVQDAKISMSQKVRGQFSQPAAGAAKSTLMVPISAQVSLTSSYYISQKKIRTWVILQYSTKKHVYSTSQNINPEFLNQRSSGLKFINTMKKKKRIMNKSKKMIHKMSIKNIWLQKWLIVVLRMRLNVIELDYD